MRTSSIVALCLQCLYVFVSPEEHGRERRDLSMLRMGKRGGVEVLPARAISLPPLVPPNYVNGYEERELIVPDGEMARQVWIPRVGKDLEEYDDRFVRAPPFPRLGKTFEDYLSEFRRELSDNDDNQVYLKYPRVSRSTRTRRSLDDTEAADESQVRSEQKRSFSGLNDDELFHESERAAPLPRMGLMERAAPLPRLGFQERAMPFPRLGLRDYEDYYFDNNEVERAAPFPRLGVQERAMPLPRMGYRDKKAMGMLRMGRSSGLDVNEEEEKRGMSMLRMGKRAMGMLRMGKRPVSMLRMGRSQEVADEDEKRAMSMLRMGKRAMGMLRMGRSDGSEMDEEKRAMGMLRMGKRAMGMLRMGRSDNSENEKRAMGMLRMGRGMSMLRMGRSEGAEPDAEKRAMGMLRMGKRPVSMLRMGKRDTDTVQSAGEKESIAKEMES